MLLDADSFNGFVSAQLASRFTQLTGNANADVGLSIVAAGPRSNYCLKSLISGGNGSFSRGAGACRHVVQASGSRFIMQYRWMFPTVDYTFTNLLQGTAADTGHNLLRIGHLGGVQCWAKTNADGTISFFREGNTTELCNSAGRALSMDSWLNFEWQVDIDNSAGAVLCKVNGIEFLNETGLDTQNLASALWTEYATPRLAVNAGGVSTVWYLADLIVADGVAGSNGEHGSGDDGWTEVRGGCQVNPRYVIAEGAHTDSTPSSGSDRALMVDEGSETGGTGPDSDSTYDTLADVGDKESFTHGTTPDPAAPILGVVHKAFGRLDSAGAGLLKLGSRIGGTDYMGPDLGLATTYGYVSSPQGVNPATGSTWSTSAFDNSEYVDEKSA